MGLLEAATIATAGAKLSKVEDEEERVWFEDRASEVRHFIETADLLYDA